ncbi:hypothetical protein ACUODF_58570, partial [Escherichia coli]
MAHLVAVTACVSGVAHTYMAAERLDLAAEQIAAVAKQAGYDKPCRLLLL